GSKAQGAGNLDRTFFRCAKAGLPRGLKLSANRSYGELGGQTSAFGQRSEIRDPRSEKKVIRDKSPAIPATDGAIDITGLQSQLFVGTNDTHRFYGGPQKRRCSERPHRYDPILSDSNSPKILVTLKSNNAGRSGNRC